MAIHSSILAWKIPWTEETDGLQFMGLQRVGHDGVTNTFKVRSGKVHIRITQGVQTSTGETKTFLLSLFGIST